MSGAIVRNRSPANSDRVFVEPADQNSLEARLAVPLLMLKCFQLAGWFKRVVPSNLNGPSKLLGSDDLVVLVAVCSASINRRALWHCVAVAPE